MKHILICIPGLGDRKELFQFAVRHWEKRYSISTVVHLMPWMGKEHVFQPKLDKLLTLIDKHHSEGYLVSLLGASAGGSAVINAYCARSGKIHRVINVCGRMKKGAHVFPSLDLAAFRSPSFYQSVVQCEEALHSLSSVRHPERSSGEVEGSLSSVVAYDHRLSEEKRGSILILRPLFDEIVPRSTTDVKGPVTINLPSIGHGLSIALTMTIIKRKIVDFIDTKC